jgi:hypothetical protein
MTGRLVAGRELVDGVVLRLVETGIDSPPRVIDVMDIAPLGDLGDIAKLGLTLSEAKQILTRLQQVVVAVQADTTRFCVRIVRLAVMRVMSRTGGFIGWRRCLALCRCVSRGFAAPAVAMARPASVGGHIADPHPSSTNCEHMFLL